jgi:2-keto-4-pentenoate hydratase
MGHPLDSLAWLANLRSTMGDGLRAGEFVSTGTCTTFATAPTTGG